MFIGGIMDIDLKRVEASIQIDLLRAFEDAIHEQLELNNAE
jgi:hypothetical protein